MPTLDARVIKLLLVDDHHLVRDSLGLLLETQEDLRVVGLAQDGDDALAQAARAQPDVVLMDVDMPGLSAFAAAERIRAAAPDARVLFLSAFGYDRYLEQALRVGASGYITKAQPAAIIIDAVRRVAEGHVVFSRDVRDRLVVDADGPRLAARATTRLDLLSPREVEVLGFIARGQSKKEIAAHLRLSPKTVDNHTTHIMNKLHLHDRVSLTRFAIREGLVVG